MSESVNRHERKLLVLGACLIAVGVVLSGPPMFLGIQLFKPQPPWVDEATLAEHFHWVQTLPYWFGLLLLTGNVLFVVAAGRLPSIAGRLQPVCALVAVSIYGALVSFNYAVQIAYIPTALERPDSLVSSLSMANPASIAWSLEMFGYAFLGAAVWLVAPGFRGTRLLDAIRVLLIVDGVVSVVGALVTAVVPMWVLTLWGLLAYAAWNLLLFVTMLAVVAAFRLVPDEDQNGQTDREPRANQLSA